MRQLVDAVTNSNADLPFAPRLMEFPMPDPILEFTRPDGQLMRRCPQCLTVQPVDRDHFPKARDKRCTDCGAPHGTWDGYNSWKCRCDLCTVAGKDYRAKRWALPDGQHEWDGRGDKPLFFEADPTLAYDEDDPRHGTIRAYWGGCRCWRCSNARTGRYEREKHGAPALGVDEQEPEMWEPASRGRRKLSRG
jgi:hypothetical protein